MSRGRSCGKCTFFHAIEGECRRNPPTVTCGWPNIDTEDWCGEFEPARFPDGCRTHKETEEWTNERLALVSSGKKEQISNCIMGHAPIIRENISIKDALEQAIEDMKKAKSHG
jgi:hypothetical protein